ncbi:MAG: ABC transporter permease [bacterium]
MIDVIRSWLNAALHRDALDREMSDEMREHLDRSTERLMARGMSRDDAMSVARREFGNIGALQEQGRTARGALWIESLRSDFRYALRGLRANPVFATVAILSLAIGIGANTAIFSLINAVVLRSLPVERPAELVQIVMTDSGRVTNAATGSPIFTNPFWEALRARATGFAGFAASGAAEFDLANGGEARMVSGIQVNGEYFSTLGVHAAQGRLFTRDDDVRGCAPTVVVSHRFWQSELGGRTDVINTPLRLSDKSYTIIGVTPASFSGIDVGEEPKLYTPLCALGNRQLDARTAWWLRVIARTRPGASIAQANASLATVSRSVLEASASPGPDNNDRFVSRRLLVRPAANGLSFLRLEYSPALFALMGMVGLVLLISCANVANLLLARGMARSRETAIRIAIGASRSRLIRQNLAEGVVLAAMGAALGVGIAQWGSRVLVALLGNGDPVRTVSLDLSLDLRVLAFTLAVGVATVMICALIPAWRATRVDPQSAMKSGGRGTIDGQSRFGVVKALVVGQCALALILVVAAALLVGSFTRLLALDPGFRAEGVLVASVDMSRLKAEPAAYLSMQQRLLRELRAQPETRDASLSSFTPVSGTYWNEDVVADGDDATDTRDRRAWFNQVSDGYFATMGTRLISGRDFGSTDRLGASPVAIVNRATAKRYFGKQSPIGRVIRLIEHNKPGPAITIVGLVEDTKYGQLREEQRSLVYLATSQDSVTSKTATYEVRVAQSPSATIARVKAVAEQLDQRYSLRFTALSDQLANSLQRERMLAALSAFFGTLALLLAMLGLYGVMSYMVARRRVEIGIRVALGAARSRIVRLVLGDVFRMMALGIAIGGVGAFALSRLLNAFLFGLTPNDPRTMIAAVAVLSIAALAAGAIPARRAAIMEPVDALRED